MLLWLKNYKISYVLKVQISCFFRSCHNCTSEEVKVSCKPVYFYPKIHLILYHRAWNSKTDNSIIPTYSDLPNKSAASLINFQKYSTLAFLSPTLHINDKKVLLHSYFDLSVRNDVWITTISAWLGILFNVQVIWNGNKNLKKSPACFDAAE